MKVFGALVLLCCSPIALCGTEPFGSQPGDESRPAPLFSLAAGSPSEAVYYATEGSKWSAHVSIAAGYKRMTSDWTPARDHLQYGIADADVQPPNFPFSFAAQILATYSADVPNVPGVVGDFSDSYQINLGVRKIFNNSGTISPFVGGGVSIIGASTTTDNVDTFDTADSDTGLGYWISAGVYWHLTNHWHVGVQGEYSYGRVELFGSKINAGGWHAMAMFGYHW